MEEWRPLKRSRGQYEVSNLGRVRNIRTGRIRKQSASSSGVMIVHLGGYINRTHTVASLVVEAFYGSKPKRVKHIGEITDDRLENILVEEEYD